MPARAASTPKSASKRKNARAWSRADVVAGFERSDEHGEPVWEQTRLVVCLKFSEGVVQRVQRILDGEPKTTQEPPADQDSHPLASRSPEEDAFRGGASSVTDTARDVDDMKPARLLVPFERRWIDETKDFDMLRVRGTLRDPGKAVVPLAASYTWFDDAVPADAVLPPGVPLSAKEIMAFYPHHVRWKSVAVRLLNNSYHSSDVRAMQAFFRDIPADAHPCDVSKLTKHLRSAAMFELKGYSAKLFQGKPDRNLHTDHMSPGKSIRDHTQRHGFVAPTFEDLLRGVKHLPVGLDARGLTQCLAWYLSVKDSFTPKLEMSVLHTQALIRALRIPLKPYGPQNLDMNALEEFRAGKKFKKRRVEDVARAEAEPCEEVERSRISIDWEAGTIGAHVVLPLRHVLTLPYMGIGGMVCRALEMGIERAEAKRVKREGREGTRPGEEIGQSEEPDSVPTSQPAESTGAADIRGRAQREETHQKEGPGTVDTIKVAKQEPASEEGPEQATHPANHPLAKMPAGYKIPKRRLSEDSPAEVFYARKKPALAQPPGLGVSGAPRGPRMSPTPAVPSATSTTDRRHPSLPPRPPTMADAPRATMPGSPAPVSFSSLAPPPTHGPRNGGFRYRASPPPYSSTFSDLQHAGYQGARYRERSYDRYGYRPHGYR